VANRNNEIPVRRRGGGVPWWAWLLGLLLLGLLAFWLLNNLGGGNNNNSGTGTGSAGQTQAAGGANASGDAGAGASSGTGGDNGAGASGDAGASGGAGGDGGTGAITDLAEISGASDGASVSGRAAELDGVTVQSVTGDVTFWVGESAEDRVFVRMDEEASGGEQGIQVREGQTLRITGQVEDVPADTAAWELEDEDATALGEEPVYIAASKVEVVQ
jgi:hypothetical protein